MNTSLSSKNSLTTFTSRACANFSNVLTLPLKKGIEKVSETLYDMGNEEFLTLQELWNRFSDIAINNDDEIENDFIQFEAGTSGFEVWHWFDKRCTNNLHDDLLYKEDENGDID